MGLSKLWGKDSSGARGFVFSHVKSIYYNWSQKKLLSTKLDEIDKSISSLNSRMPRSSSVSGETDSNSMIYTEIAANAMAVISAYAKDHPVVSCLTGSNLWAFKVYDIVTGQPVGSKVSVTIQYRYIT